MKRRSTNNTTPTRELRERGTVFVEATLVVPAFAFLVLACIQLMVIGWKLSQVQLNTAEMARTIGLAPAQGSQQNHCAQAVIDADAQARGNEIFGVGRFTNVAAAIAGNTQCTPGEPLVLTVTYTAPLFFGALVPGGINFNYMGQAVVFPERANVE